MDVLLSYHWPGNVRELKHVLEGAVAVAPGEFIEPTDLWMNVALSHQAVAAPPRSPSLLSGAPMSLEAMERLHIEQALKHFNWNRAKTAQALGITPKTLYLKIKRYQIKIPSGL